MSAYRSTVKCKFSYLVLCILTALCLVIVSFFSQLGRHIEEIGEYKGREAANSVISRAVEKSLKDFSNTEFITVCRDSEGKIISADVNSAEVNGIQNALAREINLQLKNLDDEKESIPIGTLTGITYLSGKGFDVGLRFHQLGAANYEMKSSFEGAGINQTKFRLYIHVDTEIKSVLPGKSSEVTVSADYLVAETVIIGEVPEMYLSK
ncbi:MAG: sporulation protein YunB [Ruminococcus sp.]|nr:sporulation protein YunB [Ruminococcus sp.]